MDITHANFWEQEVQPQQEENPALNEQIELWKKGRALLSIVGTEGFEILMDTIQNFVDGANQDLVSMAPGDANVIAAHASVSALYDLNRKLRDTIATAVKLATEPPDEITKAAQIAMITV